MFSPYLVYQLKRNVEHYHYSLLKNILIFFLIVSILPLKLSGDKGLLGSNGLSLLYLNQIP